MFYWHVEVLYFVVFSLEMMYVVHLNEHAYILEMYKSGKGRVGWRHGETRNGLNGLCTVTHSWLSLSTHKEDFRVFR